MDLDLLTKGDSDVTRTYQVKLTTPLRRLMSRHAKDIGGYDGNKKLYFGNIEVHNDDTPATMGLKDGDELQYHFGKCGHSSI